MCEQTARVLVRWILHTCVRDVVDDNNTVSASIIRGSDSSETFLSCSVPLSTNQESQRYGQLQAGRIKGNTDGNELETGEI
jgi:hypothetical protein